MDICNLNTCLITWFISKTLSTLCNIISEPNNQISAIVPKWGVFSRTAKVEWSVHLRLKHKACEWIALHAQRHPPSGTTTAESTYGMTVKMCAIFSTKFSVRNNGGALNASIKNSSSLCSRPHITSPRN